MADVHVYFVIVAVLFLNSSYGAPKYTSVGGKFCF